MNRSVRRALAATLVVAVVPGIALLLTELWRGRCAGCGWPRWPQTPLAAEEAKDRGPGASLRWLDGPIHPTEACYEAWGEGDGSYLEIYDAQDVLASVACAADFRLVRAPGQVTPDELERRTFEEALPPHLSRASEKRFLFEVQRGQLIVLARRDEQRAIRWLLRRLRDEVGVVEPSPTSGR